MSTHSTTQSAGTPERDELSTSRPGSREHPTNVVPSPMPPMGRAGLAVGFQMLLNTELQCRQSPRAAAEGMLNTHGSLPPREDKTS